MEIKNVKNLFLAYSNISDGNMSEKYGQDAISNRENFIKGCGFEVADSVIMNLVGNENILSVNETLANSLDAEGLMTILPELPLLLLTADCIPAVLYDDKNKTLGLLHLGRVNTDKKLLLKMIDMLIENGAGLDSLKLILGPGIRKESYVFKDLPELESDWSNFSHKENGAITLDLFGFNVEIAKTCGLKEENIVDINIDTFIDRSYYSHRRSLGEDTAEGRFLTVAALRSID